MYRYSLGFGLWSQPYVETLVDLPGLLRYGLQMSNHVLGMDFDDSHDVLYDLMHIPHKIRFVNI